MEISRRSLLKLGGILGASATLPGCARKAVLTPKDEPPPPLGVERFTQSVCGLCPAGCAVVVRRVDGHAVGVSGVAQHPLNQGALCPKGPALLQELYHPDRLKYPLARGGPRGKGAFSSISWEDALRRVAEKLSGGGTPRFAAIGSARPRDADSEALDVLAASLGGRRYGLGFAPSEPPVDAYRLMHGRGEIACDPAGARLVVSFGFDWLQTHPSHVEAQRLWGRLRTEGARAHVVQVEPRFSVTAGKADSWAPVRPGTEGFLALGIARQMIAVGRCDERFLNGRAHGFAAFAEAVEPFTIERVSQLTDLPQSEVRLLCAKFSTTRPSVALCGRGAPWTQMAVHALNALSGSLGAAGFFAAAGDDDRAPVWPAPDPRGPLPEVLLFDRVNPVFTAPGAWKAALDKASFVATVSPHMTETAEYSDIVLPCNTPLERLFASRHLSLRGTTVVNASSRGVEPMRDVKDPGDIFLRLARGGDWADFVKAKAQAWAGLSVKDGEGTWRELAAGGGPLFAARSGRFEFDALTEAIGRLGPAASTASRAADASPDGGEDARPPASTASAARDKDFPLDLCVYTPLPFSCGEGAHLPYLQSLAGVQTSEQWESWAEIHPETAKACGVKDGQTVALRSRSGAIRVKVLVLAWAMPGVVSVPFGLGHAACGRWAEGVGANPMEIADDFEGARVRLEPV